MPYHQEIEDNAIEYGYKTSNLMYLAARQGEIQTSSAITTSIPRIVPIKHDIVVQHLDDHHPQWRGLFNDFVASFKAQGKGSVILSEQTKADLSKLRDVIEDCFNAHPLDSVASFDDWVMVRSTGREDSTDLSNPGGNDSGPCRAQDVGRKIGEIAASYLSEKSLLQRLGAGDDITVEPFYPILVQSMIREIPGQNMVVSGVIYSGNGTRIQAAPGHGELVVNSKGNVDHFYISPRHVIYSEVKAKHHRLVPQLDEKRGAVNLEMVKNDDENLTYESCLDEEVLLHLDELSQNIQNLYGMRMDMEFIYEPSTKILHLVQARSINQTKDKGLEPCAVKPSELARMNQDHRIGLGQAITPDIKSAIVIEKAHDVIICQTIAEALSIYQQRQDKPRGVIVQQEAGDASHEAGEFTKSGVVVLQIDHIDDAKKYVENDEHLLLDPQRKSVYHISKDMAVADIIDYGLFNSALSSYVTPIEQTGRGFAASQQDLSSFLTRVLNHEASNLPVDEALRSLSTPHYGQKNDEHKKAAVTVLRAAVAKYQRGDIDKRLMKNILLSGAEMFAMLEDIEDVMSEEADMMPYLDSLEKFTGLFRSPHKKDTVSSSVATSVKAKRHEDNVMQDVTLEGQQKQYYVEVMKLSPFFITQDDKEKWRKFCHNICSDEHSAAKLGNLVGLVVKNNIHELWLNMVFSEAYDKYAADHQAIFADLEQSMPDMAKFDTISAQLNKMESQISAWGEANSFQQLYPEFKQSLDSVNDMLHYDGDAMIMDRMLTRQKAFELVDIMDKTIKKVGHSTMYDDVNQQGIDTKTLLAEFFDVMQYWSKEAKFRCGDYIIEQMQEYFDQKLPPFTARDLSPSAEFSVSNATIDAPGQYEGFRRGFGPSNWDYMHGRARRTLEDFFTLVHQNCILSISRLSQKDNEILTQKRPDLVTTLCDAMENLGVQTGRLDTPPISLVYSTLEESIHKFYYNVPLRNHSAIVEIDYDVKHQQQGAKMKYTIFGHNGGSRWNMSELCAYVDIFLNSDMAFTHDPYYDQMKDFFSFEVALTDEKQINVLASTLVTLCDLSYSNTDESPARLDFDRKRSNILLQASMEDLQVVLHYIDNVSNTGSHPSYQRQSVQSCFDVIRTLRDIVACDGQNIQDLILDDHPIVGHTDMSKALIDKWGANIDWTYRKHDNGLSVLEQSVKRSVMDIADIDPATISQHPFLLFYAINNRQYYWNDRTAITADSLQAVCQDGFTFNIHIPHATSIDDKSQGYENRNRAYLVLDYCDEKHPVSLMQRLSQDSRDQLNDMKEKDAKQLLHRAACMDNGNKFMQAVLQDQNIESLDIWDDSGLTALSIAAQNHHSSAYSQLLESSHHALFSDNKDGSTAFSYVSDIFAFNRLCDAKKVIAKPADKENLQKILVEAVTQGNINVVKSIVEMEVQCDPNCRNSNQETLVNIALKKRYRPEELALLLAKHGYDAHSYNSEGKTPGYVMLEECLKDHSSCSLERFKSLVQEIGEANIDLSVCNKDGKTVFSAIDYSHWEGMKCFEHLCDVVGMKPSDADKQQLPTVLHRAITHGNIRDINVLLDAGVNGDVNYKSDEGNSYIMDVVRKDRHSNHVAFRLSEAGFDSSSYGQEGLTPFSMMVRDIYFSSDLKGLVEKCRKFGIDMRALNKDQTTAFSIILDARDGWSDTASYFVELGLKISHVEQDRVKTLFKNELEQRYFRDYTCQKMLQSGLTLADAQLMHQVVRKGSFELSVALIESGSDMSLCNDHGVTVLSALVAHTHPSKFESVIGTCLDAGVDLSMQNDDHTSVFSSVKNLEQFKILRDKMHLLPREADQHELQRLLCHAIDQNTKDDVTYLLEFGVIPNVKSLCHAATANKPEIMACFTKAGADFACCDEEGRTVFSYVSDATQLESLRQSVGFLANDADQKTLQFLLKEALQEWGFIDDVVMSILNCGAKVNAKNAENIIKSIYRLEDEEKQNNMMSLVVSQYEDEQSLLSIMVFALSDKHIKTLVQEYPQLISQYNDDQPTVFSEINFELEQSYEYRRQLLTLSQFIKPSQYDQEQLVQNAKQLMEAGKDHDILIMVKAGTDIHTTHDGKTIVDLAQEKEWDEYRMKELYTEYDKAANPDMLHNNIALVAQAIVQSAIGEEPLFSSKAKEKMSIFIPKIAQTIKAQCHSTRQLESFLEVDDIGPNVLKHNEQVKQLGKQLMEQIDIIDSKSRTSRHKKSVNMDAIDDFIFVINPSQSKPASTVSR